MRRESVWRDEQGSAALEFLLVGLVMLVPIVYLIVALGQIQSGALAAEAAARHVTRSISSAVDETDAAERSARVLSAVASEYGLAERDIAIDVTCAPSPDRCPAAGVLVRVTVRVTVALPLVPDVWGLHDRARVPVEATSVQKMSRVWGAG